MFNFFKNLFTKTIMDLDPENYKGVIEAEKALDKNRILDLKDMKSNRYTYGTDEGNDEQDNNVSPSSSSMPSSSFHTSPMHKSSSGTGTNSSSSSYSSGGANNISKSYKTGLYTARQMHEAGIDTSKEDRPDDVQQVEVPSTAIEDLKYSPKKRIAEVTFKNGNGTAYSYPNVSPQEIDSVIRAPSKGIAFHKYIQPHSVPDFRGKI